MIVLAEPAVTSLLARPESKAVAPGIQAWLDREAEAIIYAKRARATSLAEEETWKALAARIGIPTAADYAALAKAHAEHGRAPEQEVSTRVRAEDRRALEREVSARTREEARRKPSGRRRGCAKGSRSQRFSRRHPSSNIRTSTTLERAGMIRRQPRAPRSIEVLVPPEHLPTFEMPAQPVRTSVLRY